MNGTTEGSAMDYASYNVAGQAMLQGKQRIHDVTIGDNIANRIEMHQREIASLVDVRAKLEKANLLDVRIDDLRKAMMF